jgi:hypothetical protein
MAVLHRRRVGWLAAGSRHRSHPRCATLRRHEATAARWALASALLISLTLVVFFVWVFPGNQATANWTSVPGNWEELRRNWEYGHAVNAVITFVALMAAGRAITGSPRH